MANWTSQRSGSWSDDAANVTSPWNGGGNPASGVPANTDTVTIALTHDVEYDYDMSGFAAGITLTITGTLHASTTAGSYVLKLAANMTGAGTLRAGTSGTPYPTNCTFEIMRGGFEITATNMTLDLNCSEPTTKYVKLSGVEAIGQTVLSVDTDVTGAPAHWYAGAIVRICDSNFGNDNEERIIAAGGVAAGTITVTAGLTAQKEIGAYLILVSRNVRITHTAATGSSIAIAGGTSGRVLAELRNGVNGFSGINSGVIGGSVSGFSSGLTSNNTIGNIISAAICGNTNGILTGFGNVIDEAIIAGCVTGISTGTGFIISQNVVIAGCVTGVQFSTSHLLNGCSIIGCTTGIDRGSCSGVNLTLNNTTDISILTASSFYNSVFNGVTEFAGYTSPSRNIASFVESIDHDGVGGAYKAWARGGIVNRQAVIFPTGYTTSQQHALESATYYCFQNYSITVPAGGGLVVECYARKDALMTYLPRVWILLPGTEPFISGSPDYESIMTNSVDTWETLVLVYANATTAPVTVTVRTVAKNATGNAYFYPINAVLASATYDVYSTLESDVGAIKAKTDNLPADPADQSAVEAAITAATSPLATGAYLITVDTVVDDILAQIGVAGAGLTALGDARLANLDAAVSSRATAASITTVLANIAALPAVFWAYATRTLTQTAQSVIAAVTGSATINIIRGDTFSETISGIPADVSDNDDLWFTYKRHKTDSDTAAILMIKKSVGLVRINGEAATVPGNGAIVASSSTSVHLTLEAIEAAKLEVASGYYDIQKRKGDIITTVPPGNCYVISDITKAIV